MATRTTTNSILSSNSGSNNLANRPTLKEILLDFKVDAAHQQNIHKIRLVGEPIVYLEYSAKKKDFDNLDDKGRPTEISVPFPDSEINQSFTRIGHDDPSQCEWAKAGYISSKKYAQNCIERYADGTFAVKIINKGATVFKPMAQWENGQLQENVESGESNTVFLGGRKAPMVKVTADYAPTKPGKVEYTVNIPSKEYELTEDEIKTLMALNPQTSEQLKEAREDYEVKRSKNPYLPLFEDFFVGGHNLLNIFKYTPPKTGTSGTSNSGQSRTETSNVATITVDNDDDLTLSATANTTHEPVSEPTTSHRGRPKTVSAATATVFEDIVEDEKDEWEL